MIEKIILNTFVFQLAISLYDMTSVILLQQREVYCELGGSF